MEGGGYIEGDKEWRVHKRGMGEMEGGGCMRELKSGGWGCMKGKKSGGWRVHEGDEEWRVGVHEGEGEWRVEGA